MNCFRLAEPALLVVQKDPVAAPDRFAAVPSRLSPEERISNGRHKRWEGWLLTSFTCSA